MSGERSPPSWLGLLRECHAQAHTWDPALTVSFSPWSLHILPHSPLLLGRLSGLSYQPASPPPVFLPSESSEQSEAQLQS